MYLHVNLLSPAAGAVNPGGGINHFSRPSTFSKFFFFLQTIRVGGRPACGRLMLPDESSRPAPSVSNEDLPFSRNSETVIVSYLGRM